MPNLRTPSATLLALCCTFTVHAASQPDTTAPASGFLDTQQVPDSVAILPPPPEFYSIDFLRDKARYDEGKMTRKGNRGQQAVADGDLHGEGIAHNFSDAFGYAITAQQTPALIALLNKVQADARLSTRAAKQHYARIRPFSFMKEQTCRPQDEARLEPTGSYPSGYAAVGWATALVLAELNPARQTQILKRGFEVGQSRVICGYHWQSDIDAARTLAGALVARLHADPAFMAQLNKAKAELRALKKKQAKP